MYAGFTCRESSSRRRSNAMAMLGWPLGGSGVSAVRVKAQCESVPSSGLTACRRAQLTFATFWRLSTVWIAITAACSSTENICGNNLPASYLPGQAAHFQFLAEQRWEDPRLRYSSRF